MEPNELQNSTRNSLTECLKTYFTWTDEKKFAADFRARFLGYTLLRLHGTLHGVVCCSIFSRVLSRKSLPYRYILRVFTTQSGTSYIMHIEEVNGCVIPAADRDVTECTMGGLKVC